MRSLLLITGMLISPYGHASDWRQSVYNFGSSLKPSKEAIAQKTADFRQKAMELVGYKGVIGTSIVILGALLLALRYGLLGGSKPSKEDKNGKQEDEEVKQAIDKAKDYSGIETVITLLNGLYKKQVLWPTRNFYKTVRFSGLKARAF